MHELSPSQQSFGGKCGLTGTESRQKRPAVTWLAEQLTLARWLVGKCITGSFISNISESTLLILTDLLLGFKQYSSFVIFYYTFFWGSYRSQQSIMKTRINLQFLLLFVSIFLNLWLKYLIFSLSTLYYLFSFLKLNAQKPVNSGRL